MKVCLDTNAYVTLKTGKEELTELLEKAEEILVPATTLGELHTGFFIGSRQKRNLKELNEFLGLSGVSVISIDERITERYGQLVKTLRDRGTPIPTNDIWIAAAAFETGARLVSYDKHFQKYPA